MAIGKFTRNFLIAEPKDLKTALCFRGIGHYGSFSALKVPTLAQVTSSYLLLLLPTDSDL